MDNNTYCSDLTDGLGKGTFGSVFKGYKKHDKSSIVAIKEIRNDEPFSGFFASSANKELDTLKKVSGHENIVELLGFHSTSRFLYIIMEYCELGDLQDYLKKKPLKFHDKFDIIKGCAEGVYYLHSLSPPVIHRDIKLRNILMTKTLDGDTAKIADFGLARIWDSEEKIFMSTDAGTPMFKAPEFFHKGRMQYTAAVDTFSLGLVFVVLCKYDGKSWKTFLPFSSTGTSIPYGQKLLLCEEDKTPMPSILEFTSADNEDEIMTKALIMKMIQLHWEKRINMENVLGDINIIQSLMNGHRPISHSRFERKQEECKKLQTSLGQYEMKLKELWNRHNPDFKLSKKDYENIPRLMQYVCAIYYHIPKGTYHQTGLFLGFVEPSVQGGTVQLSTVIHPSSIGDVISPIGAQASTTLFSQPLGIPAAVILTTAHISKIWDPTGSSGELIFDYYEHHDRNVMKSSFSGIIAADNRLGYALLFTTDNNVISRFQNAPQPRQLVTPHIPNTMTLLGHPSDSHMQGEHIEIVEKHNFENSIREAQAGITKAMNLHVVEEDFSVIFRSTNVCGAVGAPCFSLEEGEVKLVCINGGRVFLNNTNPTVHDKGDFEFGIRISHILSYINEKLTKLGLKWK